MRKLLGLLAVVPGVVTWTTGGGAGVAQTAGCPSPILPLVAYEARGQYQPVLEQTYPDQPVAIPDLAASVDLDLTRSWMLARPDMDGDGKVDQVEIDLSSGEQVLVVTRGDGVVRVAFPGANIGDLTNYPVGDLDADGRDELVFLARDAVDGSDRSFVLPGATPVGDHQALDVAIEIPDYRLVAVGDQVDGPGTDVIVHEPGPAVSGGTIGNVISGQDLMAPGPGHAADLTPRAWAVPGMTTAVVDVGDQRPAMVSLGLTADGDGQVRAALTRNGVPTVFATAGPRSRSLFGATAVQVGDHRYLLASGVDRGGSSVVIWDLEDPCIGLPPATDRPAPSTTTTTTAPAPPGRVPSAPGASPQTGRPRFTG